MSDDSGAVVPAPRQLSMLVSKVAGGDTGLAQLWFDQRVLDRYRQQEGFRVIRSNTAGRVRANGGWSIDFGIAGDDRMIHVTAADLALRLAPAERQHWARHAVALPFSANFLVMRLGAGACFDDGEIRSW